jgi:hypothetical protein
MFECGAAVTKPAVKPHITIRETDRGFAAMQAFVRNFAASPPFVAVGVAGKAAVERHVNANETVAEIAVKHEMGLGVPERSFIRATFDQHRAKYRDATRTAFAAALQRAIAANDGTWAAQQSTPLKRFGLLVEGDIKQRIAQGIPPPLAESTLDRKGHDKSTPLIDTGQLRASIVSVIYDKRPES